jgi:hypothetical protein
MATVKISYEREVELFDLEATEGMLDIISALRPIYCLNRGPILN